MQTARKKSSVTKTPSLLGWYMTDEVNLYRVVAHTKHNITLENCYSNMHTVFDYSDFVKMRLRKVAKRDGPV